MVIIGAKGHAKEILEIFSKKNQYLYNKFKVLKNSIELREIFKKDNRFVIGVGNPKIRFDLTNWFIKQGGKLNSIISPNAIIGSWNCNINRRD